MAGFRALAEQVRDPRRVTPRRRTALRKCLERFAPYGHRATWHHLCTRAGIAAQDRDPDPERLIAALDELQEARTLWLAYEEEFAARRRAEKQHGIRQPGALDDWHRRTWGGCDIVPCASPYRYPAARLAVVLHRMIAAMEAGRPRHDCPVCGGTRFTWPAGTTGHPYPRGHDPVPGPACRQCGVLAPVSILTPETLRAAHRARESGAFAAA
ncbi:hypothetical protein SSP35_02_06420 [Streptomyces sp. NBRC 110611]|uniref:hypothetical protein n=1 Tax=Streptomyces sp. NBRC 110611 TaxID=1621259 RepID=UPI00083316BB|nr:hypothetical protein [Streptomyces sp. NBRC 110611]GAU66270.1 hypothetical protein SSP35_02_06420 [Streptomyces sp. NBRC 110611]